MGIQYNSVISGYTMIEKTHRQNYFTYFFLLISYHSFIKKSIDIKEIRLQRMTSKAQHIIALELNINMCERIQKYNNTEKLRRVP